MMSQNIRQFKSSLQAALESESKSRSTFGQQKFVSVQWRRAADGDAPRAVARCARRPAARRTRETLRAADAEDAARGGRGRRGARRTREIMMQRKAVTCTSWM
jgi:hypothetical protein